MNKLFLCDVDGTLIFNETPIIQEKDVIAIKEFKKEGNSFGLVTGRDFNFCLDLLNKYDIEPDCLITCNGALSYWNNIEIISKTISNEIAVEVYKKLIEYLNDLVPFYTAKNGENYFISSKMNNFKEIKSELSYLGRLNDKDLFEYLKNTKEDCAKITVYTRTKENAIKYLPIFKDMFSNLEVVATSDDYIEMTKQGCNKADALIKMIEIKDLDINDISFIGDGENDLPLFHMLSNTYVMKEANQNVKEKAKTIVEGVSEAIELERKI